MKQGKHLKKTASVRMDGREAFPDLDIVKLVMALIVVEVHTNPFAVLGNAAVDAVVAGIENIAVPFFFIASGFLCFRKADIDAFSDADSPGARRVRVTIVKLLRLYLIWTVIYIPVSALGFALEGQSLLKGVVIWLRGVLLVGENFCSWPLWYLLASVIGFSLVYILLRGGASWKLVFGIAAALLIAGYVLDVAHGAEGLPAVLSAPIDLYYKLFLTTRNGLFEGFFYVAFGMVLAVKWRDVSRVGAPVLGACLVIALAGCVLVNADQHLPFCVVAGACVFLLSVHRHGSGLAEHPVARNMSTGIYLTHMLFAVLFVYGVCGGSADSLLANGVNNAILYAFALGGATVVSLAACAASRRWPIVKEVFGF